MYEADYTYTCAKSTCKSDSSNYGDFKVTGYKKLGSSWSTWSVVDENEVKEFLYETGLLAIALNADPLQTYTGGSFDLTSTKCPSSGINHAVTLVGYGTESSTDYWLVKNSWVKAGEIQDTSELEEEIITCGIN